MATSAAAGSFLFVCNPVVPSAAGMLCLIVFLFCGVAIGATGIGGVAVVPLLGVALEVPVKDAVHAVMAAYIVTGLVQTSLWAYKGSLAGRDAAVLCSASMPASLLAGLALAGTPAPLLTVLTALLASASGIHSLAKAWQKVPKTTKADGSARLLSPVEVRTAYTGDELTAGSCTCLGSGDGDDGQLSCLFQAALGAAVGFGSAVTGTGGPFLLLPLLFMFRPQLSVLRSVGLAQALPLPIALSATLANSWYASVDVCMAAQLAGCIAPSVPVGVWLAHRINNLRLRVMVSTLLVVIGCASLIQMARRLLSRPGSPANSASGSGDDVDNLLLPIDKSANTEVIYRYT